MKQEKVFFPSGSLTLEGQLITPPGVAKAPGVVLCHPHPLYGGSMHNNVIGTVSRALVEEGIAALCINFRGVGASQGAHDNGEGEISDALAAVAFLSEQQVIDESALALMGYSFGGAVALAAAMESRLIKAVAAVSPAGIPELDDKKPRLVICGTEDELIPHTTVLREQVAITGGGVGSIELISGADHFWHGYEQRLARLIADFFRDHLRQ